MNEDGESEKEIAPGNNSSAGNLPNKKTKFAVPAWVLVFLCLIVVLEVICLIRFPAVFVEYKAYMTSDAEAVNGDTSKAIEDLYKITAAHPNSSAVILKTIDLSMKNGYYDVAGNVFDKYLVGINLSDSDFSRMTSYSLQLKKYYRTCDAVDQILKKASEAGTTENIDYNAITNDLNALLAQPEQDEAVIYYYLGVVTPENIESAKNQLQKSYDINPECFDVRVQLGVMYRHVGDYEKAKELNREALQKDKSDSGALRSNAIIQMLEGDLEGGLATAKKAYEAYPDGMYIRESYLIALTLDNKKEEALKIENEMTAAGEVLDDETVRLLNGDITLDDYYVRG